MQPILIPLDGSDLAEQALAPAQALALRLSANVHLLHVLSEADRSHVLLEEEAVARQLGYGYSVSAAVQETTTHDTWLVLRQNAEAYLESQAAKLQEAGVAATYEVRLGAPAEIIVEVAENRSASMVVMATHGYSGLKRWALGSVTDKVVHASPAPVLVVRGSHTPAAGYQFKHILVPLDGSALSRQALPLAIELAIQNQAQISLLTVVVPQISEFGLGFVPPSSEDLDVLRGRLLAEMGGFADVLRQHELAVTPLVVEGLAPESIVDLAETRGIDLIVMATHGYSGLKRWALGSVADRVLHETKTPLLLVRAQS
ncbi:MAG: universal stress protein [Roseiflexaceae bacterium]